MRSIKKQMKELSASSRKKLEKVMDQLSRGTGYRELHGHKLHTPRNNAVWVSIPLKHQERMIVVFGKSGERCLYFAGPHETYNHLVGSKMRQRLNDPWR